MTSKDQSPSTTSGQRNDENKTRHKVVLVPKRKLRIASVQEAKRRGATQRHVGDAEDARETITVKEELLKRGRTRSSGAATSTKYPTPHMLKVARIVSA
jgi:hypothetical protein